MKNSKIEISNEWTVNRDESYDVNPWDNSVSEDKKPYNVYPQEDMLWGTLDNFHLDLGWYGGNKKGFFGLHLYRGKDWHKCQLLEMRRIRNYDELIATIGVLTKNVETGRYNSVPYKLDPIDDHVHEEEVITFNN